VAGADDVADAGEQVGFTNSSRRSARTGEDDDEQRVAEGFQFRPAVCCSRASAIASSCRLNWRCRLASSSGVGSCRPVQTKCSGWQAQR
jgi:hypothetical protein